MADLSQNWPTLSGAPAVAAAPPPMAPVNQMALRAVLASPLTGGPGTPAQNLQGMYNGQPAAAPGLSPDDLAAMTRMFGSPAAAAPAAAAATANQVTPTAPAATASKPIDTAALNAATQGAPQTTTDADGNQVVKPPLPASMGGLVGDGGAGATPTPSGPVPGGGAAAAAPYDPNAPGAWQTYAATQDHTLYDPFNQGGGGAAVLGAGAPGAAGAGRFTDPSGAIANGYQQQLAYQRQTMAALINAARTGGSPLNASLRFAHLAPAFAAAVGANNFGGVQGQGVDSLNQATGSLAGQEAYAGAMTADAKMQAQEHHYATDQSAQFGEVGSVPNVPGMPIMGNHPIYGWRERVNGVATGNAYPFALQGAGAVAAPGSPTPPPTLTQYISAGHSLNPGMTDDQLTAQYNAKYRKGQ